MGYFKTEAIRLGKESSRFEPELYFYQQPVKVADGIKMVWEKRPGNQSVMIAYGTIRTDFLTKQMKLFVCGENVGEESRKFTFMEKWDC